MNLVSEGRIHPGPTIKPHLFYSFMIHTLVLAYLLSIPVYIGSEFSINFGSYTVDLVNEERPTEESTRGYEPSKSKVVTFEKSAPQAKARVKSSPSAVPEPESIAEAKGDETAEIPSGISLMEDKPKEAIIAKADIAVQEQKHETAEEINEKIENDSVTKDEETPEPVPAEPVQEETPPMPKPQPEVIKKEALQVQEPKAVHVADEKPSKVERTDEQLQEYFPVKSDEKSQEVSPLTMKEKTLLPKKPSAEEAEKESPQVKEAEKLMVTEPTSEEREVADKKAGAGEGKDGKLKKDVITASRSSSGRADAKSDSTERGVKNGKSEKRAAGTPNKDKGKEIKVALPVLGELFRKGGGLIGSQGGDGMLPSTGGSAPKGDASQTGTGKANMGGTAGSGTKIAKELTEKKRAMGIVIPLLSDIKVEVYLQGADGSIFSSQLYRRTHPSDDEENRRSNEQAIRLIKESDNEGKAIFYVAKAEKGIYTFTVTNKSEILQKTDFVVRLLEGKKGARNRKFEAIELAPNTELKIKFILPEAVFWDDDSYFTGVIESSDSVSKFNDMTGIVWKEEKE